MPMIEISDEHFQQLTDMARAHEAEAREVVAGSNQPYPPERLLSNLLTIFFIEAELRQHGLPSARHV